MDASITVSKELATMFLAFEKIQATLSADSRGQGQGIMGDVFLYALDDLRHVDAERLVKFVNKCKEMLDY